MKNVCHITFCKLSGKALDVLEYEKSSFENLFTEHDVPQPLQELMFLENVIFNSHVAGWTVESHQKLATIVASKIIERFGKGSKAV